MFVTDISPEDVMRYGVKSTLDKFEEFLQAEYGDDYKKYKQTPFALKFKLYDELEIDLLPSPYWGSAVEYHRFLSRLDKENRRKYFCIYNSMYIMYFFITQISVWQCKMGKGLFQDGSG